jgi:hypothetical protein
MCRFVNDKGKVMERFLGLEHIERSFGRYDF